MDWSNYVIGGLASVGAVLFTNPFEVIKIRIQLQGELAHKGTYTKPYSSVLQAFITVGRNDGVLGLQKGLVPAMYFQFIINFIRLGLYASVDDMGLCSDRNGNASFSKILFWGAAGGVAGCYVSSPFFLVKTQIQAQAASKIAVGYQHKHRGMTSALREIYAAGGVKGLYHGAVTCLPRAALGSGAQIAAFGTTKDFLRRHELITNETVNSIVAGIIAGTVMCLVITPPDVIATRFYNQEVDKNGKGMYYRGFVDCLWKVWKIEGMAGLYKGFWPNYLRVGPHSMLVLLFFDEMMAVKNKYWNVDN